METTDLKTLYMSNLKAVKDSLDKSVAKMASDMNMSASTINSYIQGERTVSLEILTRLYKTYNVNANWFCTGEGAMFNTLNPDVELMNRFEELIEQKFKERGL